MSPWPTGQVFQNGGSLTRDRSANIDTAIASIAQACRRGTVLKSGDFEANKNTKDEALLKMTAQVFATQRTQPQLIVLHLMGSHPQACGDRTRENMRSLYNQRDVLLPLHHDANRLLLSKLYGQLRKFGDSFSMVYFSDHGLAFKERGKEVQYLAPR